MTILDQVLTTLVKLIWWTVLNARPLAEWGLIIMVGLFVRLVVTTWRECR